MNYRCPLCQQPLLLNDRVWCCDNNHRFDCAKEGYVNLLPVQKKRSKDPGDNKEMMFARREFLNKGYYQCMSDRVNALAQEYAPNASQGLVQLKREVDFEFFFELTALGIVHDFENQTMHFLVCKRWNA